MQTPRAAGIAAEHKIDALMSEDIVPELNIEHCSAVHSAEPLCCPVMFGDSASLEQIEVQSPLAAMRMRAPAPVAAAAGHIRQTQTALLHAAWICGPCRLLWLTVPGRAVHIQSPLAAMRTWAPTPAAAVAAENIRQTYRAVLHAARPGILSSVLAAGPYGHKTC